MKEIWIDIENTNGLYQMSNLKRVKRVDKNKLIKTTGFNFTMCLNKKERTHKNFSKQWQQEFGKQFENENEIWKDIKNFEGYYQVSNFGRIRSIDRMANYKGKGTRCINGEIKKLTLNEKGYLKVSLWKEGKNTTREVQRFVAEVFIPNPNNLPQVNHISGDKTNNMVENLEWCTEQENSYHSINVLKNIIVGVDQFDLNGNYIATYESIKEASAKTGARRSSISSVLSGKRNKAGNYIWKYHKKLNQDK